MDKRRFICSVAAVVVLAACDHGDTTGPQPTDTGTVAVGLGIAGTGDPNAEIAPSSTASLADATVTGTNGSLTITDLHVIMTEFELDGEYDGRTCAGDDCEDFQEGPLFIDVPLDGGIAAVVRGPVPSGDYRALEFEVEDLDDDEEDPAERERIAALLQESRAEFPDWPRDASLRVAGSFQPEDGSTPVEFVVYAESEVEVELELVPHLIVAEGDNVTVPVRLDLGVLFRRPDGAVLDLSRQDFANTEQLLEIEVEIQNGFVVEAEIDD